MALRGEVSDNRDTSSTESGTERIVYVLHPNCAVEDF